MKQNYPDIFKQIMERYRWSQSNLAVQIGISPTVISQILENKYELVPESFVCNAIEKFLAKANNKVYETRLLKVVFRMLQTAFDEKEIVVVTSRSGAGKTTAIEQFCMLNQFAVNIRVNAVFRKKYLLQVICKNIGQPYLGMNTDQLYEIVSESFVKRNRLLIIDEAERLSVGELELLRDLYDQGNIGLCLVGLDDLRTLLKKGKSLRENLVQLYSRVAYNEVVDILMPGDVKMIFDDKFTKHTVSQILINKLAKQFEKHGGLRAILKLSNLCIKHAEKENCKIEDWLIEESTKELSL